MGGDLTSPPPGRHRVGRQPATQPAAQGVGEGESGRHPGCCPLVGAAHRGQGPGEPVDPPRGDEIRHEGHGAVRAVQRVTVRDPVHHGATARRELGACRGGDEHHHAVGQCRPHEAGRAWPGSGNHQQAQAAARRWVAGLERPGGGADGLRQRPAGVRQPGHPRPLWFCRRDRHGQLVRGVGGAELADEVGEVAVGEGARPDDAEAGQLREVDHQRRVRRGRPGHVVPPRPTRPGSARRRGRGARGRYPRRTRGCRGAARRSRGRRRGRDGPGRAARARCAARRRAWRAPARARARGLRAHDVARGRTPSGRRGHRPPATPARARRTAAAGGRGRTPGRSRRAPAPRPPATAPEPVAAPAAPRGRSTRTSAGAGRNPRRALTRTVPSPGCRAGGPGPPVLRSRRVVDPITIVDVASTGVTASTGDPSTTTPLVEARSSTVTPLVPTATWRWLRLRDSSSTTRPATGARPTATPGGDSGWRRPASGPPTTTRSSTERGSGTSVVTCARPAGVVVTRPDAPCSRGGIPTTPSGGSTRPPSSGPARARRGGGPARRTARRPWSGRTTRPRRRPGGVVVVARAR